MWGNGLKSVIIDCSGNDVKALQTHADANLMWPKPIPPNNKIIIQLTALLFDHELKILIADDSTINRRLLSRRLDNILPSKIVCVEAKNGEEAIARARDTSFDVIVLDEVHERHLQSDLLLGLLAEVIMKRDDLRLVLMSATINIELFSKYFEGESSLRFCD